MKSRIYFFLDFCLLGLCIVTIGFLTVQTVGNVNMFTNLKWTVTHTSLVCLFVVVLAIIIQIVKLSNVFVLYRKINELNQQLKMTAATESFLSLDYKYYRPLNQLLQSLQLLFKQVVDHKQEFVGKYDKLMLSYMNLEEKYAQSYTVQLILEEISRELDSDQLLKKTTDIIMGVFGSKRCVIYMIDEEKDQLAIRATSEFTGNIPDNQVISISSASIIARAWRNRRVYTQVDTKLKEMEEYRKRNIQSILVIPLTGHRGCLGIMVIEHELEKGIKPGFNRICQTNY